MRPAVLFTGLLLLSASAEAQTHLPSPAGNFRVSAGLSNHIPNVADDRVICLVEKRTGREICKTYAAWRERAREIEAKQQRARSDGNP
jgi:hypothetical protein